MAMEGIGAFAKLGTDYIVEIFRKKEKRKQLKKLLSSELEKNIELADKIGRIVDVYIVTEVDKRPKLAILPLRTSIGDFCIKNGLVFILDLKDEAIELFLDIYDKLHDYNEIIGYHRGNFEIVASSLEEEKNARHGTYIPMLIRNEATQLIPKMNMLKETFDKK